MANYDYRCNKCSTDKEPYIFPISHGMNEKPKVKCPLCGCTDTEKTFLVAAPFYTRGYGWLDVAGRRRDMNLYKLMNDDPYAFMRQPGEKEEMAVNLRKGGKHKKNAKTVYVGNKNKKVK